MSNRSVSTNPYHQLKLLERPSRKRTSRGVNLAQPTGFGPGPCGLGPKKPTLKKASNKEAHRAKTLQKPCAPEPAHGLSYSHMKNILFFKIYYYLWDRPKESDKHNDSNRSNNPDLPDDLDKNNNSNGSDDPNRPNDPNGLDNPDDPNGPDDTDDPNGPDN